MLARLREVGCTVAQAADGDEAELEAAVHEVTTGGLDGAPAGLAAGHLTGAQARHDHGKHDRSGVMLLVTPPSWRPDLTDPADLAEEVIRLEGYQNIPVRAVRATGGRGLDRAGSDSAGPPAGHWPTTD